MTTYFDYHIGNQIGKLDMHGRENRATLGWRCRHLKARETRILAAGLRAVKCWVRPQLETARREQETILLDERLAHRPAPRQIK